MPIKFSKNRVPKALQLDTSYVEARDAAGFKPATEPAFREWTPAVERGAKYLLAVADFDSTHGPITLDDGTPVDPSIANADIAAAGEWIRYQISKRGEA